MSLLILVFSLIPSIGYTQQCEYIPKEQGGQRFIKIDGATFFYTTPDRAEKLLKGYKRAQVRQDKIELLEDKLSHYQSINATKQMMIDDLNREVKFLTQLNDKVVKHYDTSILDNKFFIMGTTFLATSLIYGYWNFSTK